MENAKLGKALTKWHDADDDDLKESGQRKVILLMKARGNQISTEDFAQDDHGKLKAARDEWNMTDPLQCE